MVWLKICPLVPPAQTSPQPETLAASTDKMRPPPALPDELLEDILMRLPPDEPAWLMRASLASKHWLGLLTGPAFRSRYRDFHGAPSMLGFIHSRTQHSGSVEEELEQLFVPTSKFLGNIPVEGEDEWWGCWIDLHPREPNGSHGTLTRALIGGAQPNQWLVGPCRAVL